MTGCNFDCLFSDFVKWWEFFLARTKKGLIETEASFGGLKKSLAKWRWRQSENINPWSSSVEGDEGSYLTKW